MAYCIMFVPFPHQGQGCLAAAAQILFPETSTTSQPTNQPAMIILRKGGAAGDVFPSSSREGGSDPDIPFSSNQITPSSLYPLHPTLLTQSVPEEIQ